MLTPFPGENLLFRRSGYNYYYLLDGFGSVANIIDLIQNNLKGYQFNRFGETVSETGSLEQHSKFLCMQYNDESRNYYDGSRYYAPAIARFTSQLLLGGLYALNNPVNDDHWQYYHGWGEWPSAPTVPSPQPQPPKVYVPSLIPGLGQIPSPPPSTIDPILYDWELESATNCPKGQIWTQKPGAVPDKNGCSYPEKLRWLLPNRDPNEPVEGASFKEACNNHDLNYCKCGGRNKKYTGKASADKKFASQMDSACMKFLHTDTFKFNKCRWWAGMYAWGVTTPAGQKAFKKAQDKNCHCADPKKNK
jgi:RHS repeat-associated protein